MIGMRFQISADFHADIELVTGIDTKVWDLNGPHLEKISMQGQQDDMVVTAQTHEEGISIAVAEGVLASYPAEMKQIVKNHKILHRIFFITMPGETYTTDKWITVFTGKDVVNPREEALHLLQQSRTEGYDTLLERHNRRWEELWKHAEVKIRGDVKAMEAVNYSIYHLQSIAPRHTDSLSIPARGLSGQTYKGAVFWDTEMFMLDFFL